MEMRSPSAHECRNHISIGNGLSERREIGLDPVHRPHAADVMTEPAHDFVEDQDGAVLVAERTGPLQV